MELDRRKVQTAVVGDAESAEPAYMPQDQDEATAFQAQARQQSTTFWCGTLLGGCGGQLSIKIYRAIDVVPHFAHQAGAGQCGRTHLGGDSADHLYASRQVRSWLGRHGHRTQAAPQYLGGLESGQACTQVLIPGDDGRSTLRLVFGSGYDPELNALAASPEARRDIWLVRDNPSLRRTLVKHRVPFHRFRLIPGHHTRALEIGTIDSSGAEQWTPLEDFLPQDRSLLRASTASSAPALSRGPEQADTATTAPTTPADGLGTALRGLQRVLGQGTSREDVRRFADLVRRHLAFSRVPVSTSVRNIAEDLLAQAARFLGDQHVGVSAPGGQVSDAQRRMVQRVQERYERLQRQERHRKLTRLVDKLIGKLHWAHSIKHGEAYADNRALLVEVLNRPDTPAALCDLIKSELRQYPKDALDTPPPGAGRAKRSKRKRKPARRRDGRTAQASQGEQVPPPKPRSSGHALEVDQQIRDRREQILAELRTSQAPRPVPRIPPSAR